MIVMINCPECDEPFVANIAFTGTVEFDLEDDNRPKLTVLENVEVRDVAKYKQYLDEVTQIITPFVYDGMRITDLHAKLRTGFNMTKQCRAEMLPHIMTKLNLTQDKDRLFFKRVPCEV